MQTANPVARPGKPETDLGDVLSLQPDLSIGLPWNVTAAQWAGLFVVLGIIVRLTRYLLSFPLSADEYQLAANLLDRGFLALLQPLQYNQVAPVGFLWIESAIVRLFGFSEWSLRLFPLVCGVASVLLFRRVAGMLLQGLPLVLAVAIFAVAYYPIRYSAEVKSYACDTFCSLVLFSLAVEWWQARRQTRWLWWMTGLAPLTLAISFPAAFVCGGISLGIAWVLWRERSTFAVKPALVAWVAFNLVVAIAFLGLMRLNISAQYDATRHDMTDCWAACFPPWQKPWQLPLWLAIVHTSEMFAYPIGAENGGSVLTSICFGVALWSAFRRAAPPPPTLLSQEERGEEIRPRREVAVTVAAWFGLSLIAAALHRYPYGGHARLSQYLAPAICLLTGSGAAILLTKLRRVEWQIGAVRMILIACLAIGGGTLVRDVLKPYKDVADRDHREFARRFWNAAPEARTECLMTDLGLKAYDGSFVTAYLCNQRIYSAAHRDGGRPLCELGAAADRPLRCVAFHSASARKNDEVFSAWMRDMLARYDLTNTETHEVPLAKTHSQYFDFYVMCYDVYYFEPKVKVAGAVSPARRD